MQALKQRFGELLLGDGSDTSNLSAGQMLLMGFNGLFTHLADIFAEMLSAYNTLDMPILWRKIDVVREARGLQVCEKIFNKCSYQQLAGCLLVK